MFGGCRSTHLSPRAWGLDAVGCCRGLHSSQGQRLVSPVAWNDRVASGSAAREGSVTGGVNTLGRDGRVPPSLPPATPLQGPPEVCSSPLALSWAWGLCRHSGPQLRGFGAIDRGVADARPHRRLSLTRARTAPAGAPLVPASCPRCSPLSPPTPWAPPHPASAHPWPRSPQCTPAWPREPPPRRRRCPPPTCAKPLAHAHSRSSRGFS